MKKNCATDCASDQSDTAHGHWRADWADCAGLPMSPSDRGLLTEAPGRLNGRRGSLLRKNPQGSHFRGSPARPLPFLPCLQRRQQVPRPRGGRRRLDHALGRVVGVARRGAELAVAEHGADLVQRRAGVRQGRRQAVAQVVDPQVGRQAVRRPAWPCPTASAAPPGACPPGRGSGTRTGSRAPAGRPAPPAPAPRPATATRAAAGRSWTAARSARRGPGRRTPTAPAAPPASSPRVRISSASADAASRHGRRPGPPRAPGSRPPSGTGPGAARAASPATPPPGSCPRTAATSAPG